MPLIDLKNCDIYFEDGYSEAGAVNNNRTGAVNNGAGYVSGVTTIVVDGFTGTIPVGTALTLDGNTGFKVTSTSQTLGNTTTINFTPATTFTLADDDVVLASGYAAGVTSLVIDGITGAIPVGARIEFDSTINNYQVSATTETLGNTTLITFTPATATALADNAVVTVYGQFIRIKVGEGTITWSEKKPREYKLDRGILDQVRNADQQPMEVNFTLAYTELTASDPMTDPPTPEDVLKQRGAAADWISVNTADPCAPYCINIRIDHNPPGCTSFKPERVVLPQYYYESLDHSPKDGTITTQGKCNALEAEVTRLDV